MSVVNGLDATVLALVYKDGTETFGVADPLPPGARAEMRTGIDPARVVPDDVTITVRLVAARLRHLLEHQPPGSYLAVLDRSPFLEPGVSRLVERGSFHLVIGWPNGQP
jgi:hypothetical protein